MGIPLFLCMVHFKCPICCHFMLLCNLIVIYCSISPLVYSVNTGDNAEAMLLFDPFTFSVFLIRSERLSLDLFRLTVDRVPLFQSFIVSAAVFNLFILSLSSLIVSAEKLSSVIWRSLHFVIISISYTVYEERRGMTMATMC